jgi:hypothetical protein
MPKFQCALLCQMRVFQTKIYFKFLVQNAIFSPRGPILFLSPPLVIADFLGKKTIRQFAGNGLVLLMINISNFSADS